MKRNEMNKKEKRMKSKSEEETKYNKLLLIMITQTESVMSSQRFNHFYRISKMRSFHFDSVLFFHLHPFTSWTQSFSERERKNVCVYAAHSRLFDFVSPRR